MQDCEESKDPPGEEHRVQPSVLELQMDKANLGT